MCWFLEGCPCEPPLWLSAAFLGDSYLLTPKGVQKQERTFGTTEGQEHIKLSGSDSTVMVRDGGDGLQTVAQMVTVMFGLYLLWKPSGFWALFITWSSSSS